MDTWFPAGEMLLEPNALTAAKSRSGCLALTAGPGAGKTEMLAQRADFLLRTGTCRYPKRILAIAFKVDASQNLKDRVRGRCGNELGSRFDSYTFHAFAKRIIDRFRPLLTGNDVLPVGYTVGDNKISGEQIAFNEMVELAIEILKSSKMARNAVRQTYTDVFLDEFQDCTNKQYELIKLLFHQTETRITAVGDDKQRIMGFAGALKGIFKKFANDFNATRLILYRNYRSKPQLLRMQNEIIRRIDPESAVPDEDIKGTEGEILVRKFTSAEQEGEVVASLIGNWIVNEEVPHAEVAVLISKQSELYGQQLMSSLEDLGIPYRNEQKMQDITAEPIARLIVDYLLVIFGDREPKALRRLMNQALPFEEDDALSNERSKLDKLMANHRKIAKNSSGEEWLEIVEEFTTALGNSTLVALSPEYESQVRLADLILQTKNRITDFLSIDPNLTHALKRFTDDNAVRIMSIHKSKGLEFHTVVIMAVENEMYWGKEEDERLAFFVGISRAKRRLMLTWAQQRKKPTGHSKPWDVVRTPKCEYFRYALPFLRGEDAE